MALEPSRVLDSLPGGRAVASGGHMCECGKVLTSSQGLLIHKGRYCKLKSTGDVNEMNRNLRSAPTIAADNAGLSMIADTKDDVGGALRRTTRRTVTNTDNSAVIKGPVAFPFSPTLGSAGSALEGKRVSYRLRHSGGENVWYEGTVDEWNASTGKHHIRFDDGTEGWYSDLTTNVKCASASRARDSRLQRRSSTASILPGGSGRGSDAGGGVASSFAAQCKPEQAAARRIPSRSAELKRSSCRHCRKYVCSAPCEARQAASKQISSRAIDEEDDREKKLGGRRKSGNVESGGDAEGRSKRQRRQGKSCKWCDMSVGEGDRTLSVDQLSWVYACGSCLSTRPQWSGVDSVDDWVQCERCNAWHKVPNDISADLPEVWTCRDNKWDGATECQGGGKRAKRARSNSSSKGGKGSGD